MTTSASLALDRAALLERFRRIRRRTAMLFELLDDSLYYERPIALRNPVVFYEGHLPAFAVNTLIKKALGEPGIDARLEEIFARGIDPESEATAIARGNPAWPSRDAVRAYASAADARIEAAIGEAELDRPGHPLLDRAQALWTILEHEEMHQETLAYMWHQVPYAFKRKPPEYETLAGGGSAFGGTRPADPVGGVPPVGRVPRSGRGAAAGLTVGIPSGDVQLGTPDEESPFAWDNERPASRTTVPAFIVDRHKVTNADFMRFVDAGGYRDARWWRPEDWAWVQEERVAHPAFWERDGDEWYWRGMFERVPLPADWPVYVTWAEANAYARWSGGRLPSEAEYLRAAQGTPLTGNLDFRRWDPAPVGASEPVSSYGVAGMVGNGWEWTSTVFAPFAGFTPLPSYPEYSADFFDGEHFVMKGASPLTARELARPGFRNWFRPRYPYVYATFRCVR